MWISRVRVTGGFLNGLDLSFSKGLNVIIGPRGVGKTTLLELLRHAVGAEHAEQSGALRRRQFIEAVLGSGDVVLDIESDDGGRHVVVDSKGGGRRGDLAASVLVLGQNELEEIASDAPSRLSLLDLRTGGGTVARMSDEPAELTGQIYDLSVAIEELREESMRRARLVDDRALLLSQEAALVAGNSAALAEQRAKLRETEDLVIQTGRDGEQLEEVLAELADIAVALSTEEENVGAVVEVIAAIPRADAARMELAQTITLLNRAVAALNVAEQHILLATSETQEANLSARNAAAPIREGLEAAESGLGQITSQLRNVDAALRSLDDNDAGILKLEERRAKLLLKRSEYLDKAESEEEAIFTRRSDVARDATSRLANNVVVVVEHLADPDEFREFLQASLRGTNTRTALIESVVTRVLPRQLLEMVEKNDANGLAAVAGISMDRAQRFLDNMNLRDCLTALTLVRLTDRADFRLRDGATDKSVEELSTGQKCAVTLPIVISEPSRTLILDQPEDHLDNAFLVDNVVSGLVSRRTAGAQTIVATHNANIPVLGSADRVVVLASDGRNGAVDVEGPFDSVDVVEKITRIMEGGREAFARRSAFYNDHGGLE